jgi:4-amino-4-deoxy-L-arabinose transferase-like glycosyltransferase
VSTSSISTADTALANYLLANKGSAEYLVAVQGAQSAESLILATGEPVMAMGGFNGADPVPTLAEFQRLVAAKKVRYVLVGGGQGFAGPPSGGPGGPLPGGGGFPGGPDGSGATFSAISQWVEQNGVAVDAGQYGGSTGGGTLYQLW